MCDLIINYYWLIEQLLLLRTTQPESPYPLYSRPGLLPPDCRMGIVLLGDGWLQTEMKYLFASQY